jgi:hypothetical protein
MGHRINIMNWANANADRINSLFTSDIFTPSSLLTNGRDTVNIVLLKQLLVSLSPPEPPKVLPLEPVPADGFTVVAALRLKELRSLPNGNFDFSKLIRFCEQLNTAYITATAAFSPRSCSRAQLLTTFHHSSGFLISRILLSIRGRGLLRKP